MQLSVLEVDFFIFQNNLLSSPSVNTQLTVLFVSGKLVFQKGRAIDTGEVEIGAQVMQTIPPGLFWRFQITIHHPVYLKFNISLAKDSLLGIYGRRNIPPTHTQVIGNGPNSITLIFSNSSGWERSQHAFKEEKEEGTGCTTVWLLFSFTELWQYLKLCSLRGRDSRQISSCDLRDVTVWEAGQVHAVLLHRSSIFYARDEIPVHLKML